MREERLKICYETEKKKVASETNNAREHTSRQEGLILQSIFALTAWSQDSEFKAPAPNATVDVKCRRCQFWLGKGRRRDAWGIVCVANKCAERAVSFCTACIAIGIVIAASNFPSHAIIQRKH
jgi:hypothetical protein